MAKSKNTPRKLKKKNNKVKRLKGSLKFERKPERQSERIKNLKLGKTLPKIGF